MQTSQLKFIYYYFVFMFITICYTHRCAQMMDQTDDAFQNECLSSTNKYRSIHGAPPLDIDQNIVFYARKRCSSISQNPNLNNGHSPFQTYLYYTENLYWVGSSAFQTYPCKVAIDSWYNEVNQYDFSNPAFSSGTGHFIYLVWNSSTAMGCARCSGNGRGWYDTYIVCKYSPQDYFMKNFGENVLQPLFESNEIKAKRK